MAPPNPFCIEFPTNLDEANLRDPTELMPPPSVGHVLLWINEFAIVIVPSLWIPPPLHSETVTPFSVAFPELQTPAVGLPPTDEEMT